VYIISVMMLVYFSLLNVSAEIHRVNAFEYVFSTLLVVYR